MGAGCETDLRHERKPGGEPEAPPTLDGDRQRAANNSLTVLYAFSGPAGKGCGFEEACVAVASQMGVEVKVITDDIVSGGQFELANEAIFGSFVGITEAGRAQAVLTSPPCSTSSRARDGREGPRRLRSHRRPEVWPSESLAGGEGRGPWGPPARLCLGSASSMPLRIGGSCRRMWSRACGDASSW